MVEALAPALEEGLLVAEPGARRPCGFATTASGRDPARAGPAAASALQLAMARRLAGVPELFAVAAEQYLPVVDARVRRRGTAVRWWGCSGAPPTRRR